MAAFVVFLMYKCICVRPIICEGQVSQLFPSAAVGLYEHL